jgi:hypothetical protein
MSKLEASAPRLSRTIKLIAPLNESLAASEKNDNDSMC